MSFDLIKNFGLASIFQSLQGLSFTVSDVLDILLMAVLIYAVLKLIYETRSFPVIISISTVFVLYGLATVLNLSLTRSVLQSFLSVFIILMVIIFQNEFRRFLTYFNLSPWISKKNLPSEVVISVLSGTIRYLAEKRTGALIVFPGRESIDHYLSGGFALHGEISEPLLLSIFDESTPGHDGAVIIEGNRLQKFGVHLPLAQNTEATRGFGTRHRAGLGLSEQSDALVVIVSEERGNISVAQNGVLRSVESREELERIVKQFYHEKFPYRDTAYLTSLGVRQASLIFCTVLIAGGVWLYSNQNSPLVQKNFVVPLEFQNVPADVVVDDAVPEEVVLTLESRGGNFQALKTDDIHVPIDLSKARIGWRQFLVESDKIKVPFGFTLVKADPERTSLLIEKKTTGVTSLVKPQP